MTHNQQKGRVIAYWIVTGLLAAGMLSGGIAQVIGAKWNVEGMIHLGYPLYFMRIIGVWKLLGVIAILVPGYRLLKEWAYAGFFFVMTGAVISHLVIGDNVIAQIILVILIILSWYLRPMNRKIII